MPGQAKYERLYDLATQVLPSIVLATILLLTWVYFSANGAIPAFILPAPSQLAAEFMNNFAVLLKHSLITSQEALAGFAIGNIAAIAMALALSYSPLLRDAFYPYALISRAIPVVVLTPILVILLGRGMPAIIGIVSLSVYFPTFLNMYRGLGSVERDCDELMHSLSATGLQRLRLVQLPTALPYLFAAMKVSASITFISAVVAEWVGSNAGLGYLVLASGQYFRLPSMWAAISATAVLTLALLALVAAFERLLGRWTSTQRNML